MSEFKSYNIRLKSEGLQGPRSRQDRFQSGTRNMKAGEPSILVRLSEEEALEFGRNTDYELEPATAEQIEAALTPNQRALGQAAPSNRAERARGGKAIRAGSIPEVRSVSEVPEL